MSVQSSRNGKLQHNRQHDIYLLALKHCSVDVSELAEQFEVTTETIRRDLSDMQDRQLLRRVHGGAEPIERLNHEPMVAASAVTAVRQMQVDVLITESRVDDDTVGILASHDIDVRRA